MMKWKVRTGKNIGELGLENFRFNTELGSIVFNDYMDIFIDICDMSNNLKKEVEKLIEIEKVKLTEERKSCNLKFDTNFNIEWSNKPVIIDFTYLRVLVEDNKSIKYSIDIGFHDAVDESMEAWGGSIPVDISEHTDELKKAIIKVLLDKFF